MLELFIYQISSIQTLNLSFAPRWYFAVISVSGVFAVTFSVVFAYVADITQEHERSMAYGLVCLISVLVYILNTKVIGN